MQSGANKLKAAVSAVIDDAASPASVAPDVPSLLQPGKAAPDQTPVTPPAAAGPPSPSSEGTFKEEAHGDEGGLAWLRPDGLCLGE